MSRDPLAELIVAQGRVEPTSWEFGIVTAVAGLVVTVDVGGARIDVPFTNSYSPVVGDSAIVLRRGLRAIAVGATNRQTPTTGTVTATGATTVTCTVNGVTGLVLRRHNGYSPTIGDSVHVVDGAAADKWASVPPPPTPSPVPAPPPPAPVSGNTVFPARDSDTYRSATGGWRNVGAVYQGSTGTGANSGAWFYGTSPQDRLAGATVRNAYIWLHRMTGSGVYAAQAVHLWTHSSASKPGGDVTRTDGPADRSLAVNQAGWFPLDVGWAQALVNGTKRGIGITGDPYLRMASLGDDGMSGTISIYWSR